MTGTYRTDRPDLFSASAKEILADPAFREALTAALAEGLLMSWSPYWIETEIEPGTFSADFDREGFAAAIVAQMLPEADHATD